MAQTYSQLQKQIEALRAQADELRQAEMAEVVSKMKEDIRAYGITPQHLFGIRGTGGGKTKAKLDITPRFADADGNTWVGRGPRPQWLRDALAAGRSLDDFAVGAGAKAAPVKPAPKKAAAGKTNGKKAGGKSKAGRVKYRDSAGNSWSGFGRQPGWLADAINSGKKLEDFLV